MVAVAALVSSVLKSLVSLKDYIGFMPDLEPGWAWPRPRSHEQFYTCRNEWAGGLCVFMYALKTYPDTTNIGLSLWKISGINSKQYILSLLFAFGFFNFIKSQVHWDRTHLFWCCCCCQCNTSILECGKNRAKVKYFWCLLSKNWAHTLYFTKSDKPSAVQYCLLWRQQLESWLHCNQRESCFWFPGTRIHNEFLCVNLRRPGS